MNCFTPLQCWRSRSLILGTVMLSSLVAGCADKPPASDKLAVAEFERANDPIEPWNRRIYGFNKATDKAVLKPVAEAYRDYLPESMRLRIRSFLQNLHEPVVFANDVLQADAGKASGTFVRFMVNSTVGIVGLYDPATDFFDFHDNDVGLTLGTWGVGEGPYVVLPLMGPSNPRDMFGLAVEAYAEPFDNYAGNMGYGYLSYVRMVFVGVNRRVDNLDNLDEIERTSVDSYSTLRSMYHQYRQSIITGEVTGKAPRPGNASTFPNYDDLSQ